MKGALGVGEWAGKLGVLQLRPSEAVLVKAGRVLESRAFSGRSAIRSGEALRIQNADRFFQDRAGHFDGGDEIRVARDHDGGLIAVLKSIEKKVGGEVDIRSLFLGFEDFDGVWRGIHDGHTHDPFSEFAEDNFEVGNRAEGPPVEELPCGLPGIAGKLGDLCGEELRAGNGVSRKGAGRELEGIQPSQRRSFQRAVEEVEAIDIEKCLHEMGTGIGADTRALPPENAGAVPEGTAPRPAVETNGRDV